MCLDRHRKKKERRLGRDEARGDEKTTGGKRGLRIGRYSLKNHQIPAAFPRERAGKSLPFWLLVLDKAVRDDPTEPADISASSGYLAPTTFCVEYFCIFSDDFPSISAAPAA